MSAQPVEPTSPDPSPSAPPPSPPSRRRQHLVTAGLITLGVGALTATAVLGYRSPDGRGAAAPAASPAAASAPATYDVKYVVEALDFAGQAIKVPDGSDWDVTDLPTADLTFRAASGSTQKTGDPLPEMVTVPGVSGTFLPYVSAQLDSSGGGDLAASSIRCQVYVDGTLVAQNVADGDYSIATCTLGQG
jgi:hypothetical protein